MSQDTEGAMDYLDTPSEGAKVSVLTHVGEVYDLLADFGKDRPIDFFDPFSYIIKEERDADKARIIAKSGFQAPDFIAAGKTKSRLESLLFLRQKLTAEGEEEEDTKEEQPEEASEEKHEEEEMHNEGEVPNTPSDMRFIAPTGIGLNERETILLQRAIEKLITSKPLATARFWGKVMGVERDYYIVECEFNDGERPHADTPEEEEKNEEDKTEKEPKAPMEDDSGPNTMNYFVCTALGGKWTLLPDVTPQQIVASRSIRQLFSGSLEADVLAPPGRFDGKEKELLRAFIARVTHSCTLAPKGQYNPEEEPEEDMPLESNAPIVLDEEWQPTPVTGMEHFLHRLPCILPQGRTEFWAPEAEEEEEEPVPEKGVPILTPITEDEPIDGTPSWSVRILQLPEKLYWLRSNAWPGLSIVSNDNASRMVMHYYGWGMKATPPVEWPPLWEPKKKPKRVEEEEEEHAEEEDGSAPEDD